jgi:hypothetical protein
MTETSTATWSADDLALFGGADQIGISTRPRDGTLRPFVPIWIVTVDGALYVRSYRGADGAWHRQASTHPDGTVKTNGSQRDITFTPADPATRNEMTLPTAPSTPATAPPTSRRCSAEWPSPRP